MRRLDPFEVGGDAMKALVLLGCSARARDPDRDLMTLVKLRGLQIHADNTGYAECLRVAKEQPLLAPRLAELSMWQDSKLFSARERAALAWIEAVTDVDVPDAVYEDAAEYFRDDELMALTVAIVSASAWTRIASAFRLDQCPV